MNMSITTLHSWAYGLEIRRQRLVRSRPLSKKDEEFVIYKGNSLNVTLIDDVELVELEFNGVMFDKSQKPSHQKELNLTDISKHHPKLIDSDFYRIHFG